MEVMDGYVLCVAWVMAILHRYMYISKLTKLYMLNICSLLNVNHISIKLLKNVTLSKAASQASLVA